MVTARRYLIIIPVLALAFSGLPWFLGLRDVDMMFALLLAFFAALLLIMALFQWSSRMIGTADALTGALVASGMLVLGGVGLLAGEVPLAWALRGVGVGLIVVPIAFRIRRITAP